MPLSKLWCRIIIRSRITIRSRIIIRSRITTIIRSWITIRSRTIIRGRVTIRFLIIIRSRITIRSQIIIRIPIVGRSRNSVRSPINIRFRNTNRYRDKWCTASHIRVKKTNFGAETNSPTCSFISCFWIGGGNYLFLADFQAVSQQSIIVYSFASLKFANSALTSNPRGLNHHLKTILRSFSKLKSNSRLNKLFDF